MYWKIYKYAMSEAILGIPNWFKQIIIRVAEGEQHSIPITSLINLSFGDRKFMDWNNCIKGIVNRGGMINLCYLCKPSILGIFSKLPAQKLNDNIFHWW